MKKQIVKRELSIMERILLFFVVLCVLAGILTLWNPNIPDWIKGPALLDNIPNDARENVIPIETSSNFLISLWIIARCLIISANVWIIWAIMNFVFGLCLWIVIEVPRNFYNLFTHILPLPFIDQPKFFNNATEDLTVAYKKKIQIIPLILSMCLLVILAKTNVYFGILSFVFGCIFWGIWLFRRLFKLLDKLQDA